MEDFTCCLQKTIIGSNSPKKESLKQISDLIERFERNAEAYRTPAYNETQLRREFIDPFFEALGWDVANKAGYASNIKTSFMSYPILEIRSPRETVYEKEV